MRKIARFLAALFFLGAIFVPPVSAVQLTATQWLALELTIDFYFTGGAYAMADATYSIYDAGGCWNVAY